MKRKRPGITGYRLLLITLLVIAVLAGVVSAKYIKKTEKVKNIFIPADSVNPTVEEEFEGAVKENVRFQVGDTGYPVYVRAAIVVTWKNQDGEVYFSKPVAGEDYTIELNTTDWQSRDSLEDAAGGYQYYYLLAPVESGGYTPYLIERCEPVKGKAPEGYTLSVEIIVQTIQAEGKTDGVISTERPAKDDAWSAPAPTFTPEPPDISEP